MNEQDKNFKDAVQHYLELCTDNKRVIQRWLKTDTCNEDVFEKTIDRLNKAQVNKKMRFDKEQAKRLSEG